MTGSLQEKNGKYYAVLNTKDEHGKRKSKWISTNLEVKGNKKNAEKILRDLLDEWEDDNYKRNNILVSDYFIQWLQNIEYKVQPNTYRGYSGNMNNHIIPYFKSKNIMIQDLKHYHLEDYYNSKLKGDTPLSPTTIKHHHQNITKALNDAVKREIINFNPSVNAETPKCKKYKGNFLNTEQINQLLTVCKGTIIEIPVYIMAYYGLRRSEVLGLTWKSIDFVNNKMIIQQTVEQHTGGSYIHDTKFVKKRHRKRFR